jgi:hypothetical protein
MLADPDIKVLGDCRQRANIASGPARVVATLSKVVALREGFVNHQWLRVTTDSGTQMTSAASPTIGGPGGFRGVVRRHPWLREWLIFAVALVAYEGSRALVIGNASLAVNNATGLINWEKSSGLFVELSIQQVLLNHLDLTKVLNDFYMVGHWVVTPLFFIWLYRSRRTLYPYIRNAFLAANGIALIIYILFPVAPPRLLTDMGFVDTLAGVSKINLHAGVFADWFNADAAMPSMHFGYAFMIGIVAAVLLSNWALRILVLAYPTLVFITITGTANHYISDSLAGALVIAAGFVLVHCWSMLWPRLQPTFAGAARRVHPAVASKMRSLS